MNYKARNLILSVCEDKLREYINDISWVGSMWVILKE